MSWETRLQSRLNPVTVNGVAESSQASVVALIGRDEATPGDQIVLMKRTMMVETHKGQISFPGGFRESHDKTLLDTALRETEEEIGLPASSVRILGALSPVMTRNEIQILPWVGRISLPFSFRLNAGEVERLLYLPMETLVREGLKPVTVEMTQAKVSSIGLWLEGELVWGATARMLEELRQHLLASATR